MGINQTYAVFGLGRYGRSVAKELAENGAEVVAVDNREAVVNAAISEIPYCDHGKSSGSQCYGNHAV